MKKRPGTTTTTKKTQDGSNRTVEKKPELMEIDRSTVVALYSYQLWMRNMHPGPRLGTTSKALAIDTF